MKFLLLILGVFSFFLYCRSCLLHHHIHKFYGPFAHYNLSFSYLGPLHLIRKHGYPSEAHTIETKDGYLLQLHRIPHGKKGNFQKRGPVLLQHGFLGSSLNYLHLEPKRSLPFLLADLGFDVWLGNLRGNTYSQAHISYTPCDKKFWDFTWEESGIYDLPAMIDYILAKTGTSKLHYVGHSMGTTAFFVMLSMRPEYNNKIIMGHMLAPIAFLKHLKSPIIRLLAPFSAGATFLADTLSSGALLPESIAWKTLSQLACHTTYRGRRLCTDGFFLILGSDYDQFDMKLMGPLTFHYPAGYSVKALTHFAQLHLSGEFKQYDYGFVKNIAYYGSISPPSYNLKNITAPIVLHVGRNDYLSTIQDVKKLMKHLQSVINTHIINYSKFNHFDFLVGKDVKMMLYDRVIRDILQS